MDEAKFRDYYGDLGLSPGSPVREIKRAFYILAKRHHPDKNRTGSTNSDEFRKASVREAFETLFDEEKRLRYDRYYARMRPKWAQSQKMQETQPAEGDATVRMTGAEKARREAEDKRQALRKQKEMKAEERSLEAARRAQERQKLAAEERLRKDIEREAEERERQAREARQRQAKLEMEETQEALRRNWGPVDDQAGGWPNQVNDYYYFQGSHPQAAGWGWPGENGYGGWLNQVNDYYYFQGSRPQAAEWGWPGENEYKPCNTCSRSYASLHGAT